MTKLTDLFDVSGKAISLGHKLGSGGEGSVHEVPAISSELVAKIYHKPLKPDKQEKLRAMVQGGNDYLNKIAAWPLTTLHTGRNGQICGFLMSKIVGYKPIHELYSPAYRKQIFPNADWAFLVNAARNVAAAFEAIHANGHVIGDVNHGNLVIDNRTVVRLIDCDSFQIAANGKVHLCEVGISHFTPPELQTIKSFNVVCRTFNHDNFGLALLIFHLLFMGRHPFAGVYSGREDMPIEKAIESFRFAFGDKAFSKGMSPPPNSVTMSIVPYQLAGLFERSFSEFGAKPDGRPKAHEWVKIMDDLKNSLRTCHEDPMHKYFSGLGDCPWCDTESKAGVFFFIGIPSTSIGQTTFNIAVVWQKIMSVPSPGDAPLIDPAQFQATPKYFSIWIHNLIQFLKITCTGIAFIAGLYFPIAFIAFIFGIAIIIFFAGFDFDEKKRRETALNNTQNNWNAMAQQWKKEGGGLFSEKLNELEQLKTQYEDLGSQYAQERQKLQSTIRERQLCRYLESFFIAKHKIPNIGKARKATLASFGIETAADIEQNKILKINGFGESLTSDLVQWRKSLESKFVFNHSKGIDPKDLLALDRKYHQIRTQIENKLLGGPEALQQIRTEAINPNRVHARQTLRAEVEAAAKSLAQARADMSVF